MRQELTSSTTSRLLGLSSNSLRFYCYKYENRLLLSQSSADNPLSLMPNMPDNPHCSCWFSYWLRGAETCSFESSTMVLRCVSRRKNTLLSRDSACNAMYQDTRRISPMIHPWTCGDHGLLMQRSVPRGEIPFVGLPCLHTGRAPQRRRAATTSELSVEH